MVHQIAVPPRDKNHRKHSKCIIAVHGLFVLTVYPKKGGNFQVATKLSELLVGESPVKMHPLSLARALSAKEDGKEACFISDKMECIIEKIDVLFWRVRRYICHNISPSVHKKPVGDRCNPYGDLTHLQSFRARHANFCTRSEPSYFYYKSRSLQCQCFLGILETGLNRRFVGWRTWVRQKVGQRPGIEQMILV